MSSTGWLFLSVSWVIVLGFTIWGVRRVLTSRKHWTHPDEDIRELHHGEFGEPPPPKNGRD